MENTMETQPKATKDTPEAGPQERLVSPFHDDSEWPPCSFCGEHESTMWVEFEEDVWWCWTCELSPEYQERGEAATTDFARSWNAMLEHKGTG